jgi:hypothetical protein
VRGPVLEVEELCVERVHAVHGASPSGQSHRDEADSPAVRAFGG